MSKSFSRIFQVYVFVYVFLFASRPLSDADFWFHLRTGEYVIHNGLVPRTELFSFTNHGRPWIAHGWLSGTIFYGLYSWLGSYSLIFIFAVLAALAFWVTLRRTDSHPFIQAFATILGIWAILPNIGVRPRVFSLLFASVFLDVLTKYARRGKGRAIWLLVPMMALWGNLHGGFFIGLALIGVTMVGILLDGWSADESIRSLWPRLRTLAVLLVACLLAVLINPYGVQLYTFPLQVLSSPVFQEVIVDWLSPNFHQAELFPLLLLILLTITAIALSPKRVRPSEVLLFVTTLYATLKSNRHMAIFALVAVPLLADSLQNWLESTSLRKSFNREPSPEVGRKSILLSLALLLPLLPFAVRLKSQVYSPPRQEVIHVPLKAVAFMKDKQITGNTFTDPSIWGGYLIWELPSNPVYIDGRDVYPEQFVREFLAIVHGRIDWREPFERYGVRNVIIKPSSMLARELRDSPEWQKKYQDEMAVVFTK